MCSMVWVLGTLACGATEQQVRCFGSWLVWAQGTMRIIWGGPDPPREWAHLRDDDVTFYQVTSDTCLHSVRYEMTLFIAIIVRTKDDETQSGNCRRNVRIRTWKLGSDVRWGVSCTQYGGFVGVYFRCQFWVSGAANKQTDADAAVACSLLDGRVMG